MSKTKRFVIFVWMVLASFITSCQAEGLTAQPTLPPASPVMESVVVTSSPTQMDAVSVNSTATQVPSMTSTSTPAPTGTATPVPAIRFAVIGDYGSGGEAEARVAELVKSWNPDFVITLGDNNYPSGSAETIDDHIGKFYHEFIYPYKGRWGEGASENRFFPSLGNHDWMTRQGAPYLDYFTLPGNERYYDFVWKPVHFFVLNSNDSEPDGVGRSSAQAAWLQQALAASTETWQVVYFHAAPYTSGYHGSTTWMQWDFDQWGVDAVLAGHSHVYERLEVNGVFYFVNGLGGGGIYDFGEPLLSSLVRYNRKHGAMLVTADDEKMVFQFINIDNEVIDQFVLRGIAP